MPDPLATAREQLEYVARSWIGEPFPSITCAEADALHKAMTHLGVPLELCDEFMMHHACTDDAREGDTHVAVTDDDGAVVGWSRH